MISLQKSIKPSLPNDTVVSFYVQAQKLILAVYQLYINSNHKLDIGSKFQVRATYHQISDIIQTKSQNFRVSRLHLQMYLPNPLKPGFKSRMKM